MNHLLSGRCNTGEKKASCEDTGLHNSSRHKLSPDVRQIAGRQATEDEVLRGRRQYSSNGHCLQYRQRSGAENVRNLENVSTHPRNRREKQLASLHVTGDLLR
jgi:hypothetical protein